MHIAVVAGPGRGCLLSEFSGDGAGHERIVKHDDLCAAVAERERTGDVRWVWAAGSDIYPALLRAGVRVQRCHDVALVEALLLARDGRPEEPATLAAAVARLEGTAGPGLALPGAAAPHARALAARPATAGQAVLFDPADPAFPSPREARDALITVHADQAHRIAADEHPGRFRCSRRRNRRPGWRPPRWATTGCPGVPTSMPPC